jgi:gliding motility-associated-like protein
MKLAKKIYVLFLFLAVISGNSLYAQQEESSSNGPNSVSFTYWLPYSFNNPKPFVLNGSRLVVRNNDLGTVDGITGPGGSGGVRGDSLGVDCSSLGIQYLMVQNGPYANAASSTAAILAVPFRVITSPYIGQHADVKLPGDVNCNAVLPNYLSEVPVSDICPNVHLTVTQIPAPGSIVSKGSPDTVTIVATDGYGGKNAMYFLVSIAPPPLTIAISANNICPGVPVIFKADTSAITGGVASYNWAVNGISKSTRSVFTDSTLNDGDKVTCTVINNRHCPDFIPSDTITMHILPYPQITFGPPIKIRSGDHVTLMPKVTGPVSSYTWFPATGLSSTNIENPVASPQTTTTYTLEAFNSNGCSDKKQITVYVNVPLTIPNAFTPNGDGVNDVWEIDDLAYYPECTVDVFNRYGTPVFRSIGYTVPWDGRYGQRPIPAGTYYYIIDLKKIGVPKYSGSLTIIR